ATSDFENSIVATKIRNGDFVLPLSTHIISAIVCELCVHITRARQSSRKEKGNSAAPAAPQLHFRNAPEFWLNIDLKKITPKNDHGLNINYPQFASFHRTT